MRAFFAAFMFLTRLPVPTMQVSDRDWKKSSIYFPLVGLIIGAALYGFALGTERLFPLSVAAFFIVLVWIWITGGLHIDGWMDLADGIGSNRSKEEMLEIMKDSRVGAMGVIAAICLIGGKFSAAYELLQADLFLIFAVSPLYARYILVSAIKICPYRKEGGLGAGLQEAITFPMLLLHFSWIGSLTYWLLGLQGVLLLTCTGIIGAIFIIWIYKKFQMLTGDCYGAIVEWCECVSLFLAIVIWGAPL